MSFADKRDFEGQTKGLTALMKNLKIMADDGIGVNQSKPHVTRPGFAGCVCLGLSIADHARSFDAERGWTTKPGVLLAADIMRVGMNRQCRKRRRRAQQDSRNDKGP